MKPPYRYSISFNGKWYGLNGNDVQLFNEPYYFYGYIANWKEIGIEDVRNWEYSGIFRNHEPQALQLVKAMAKVVRAIYYTYGVQAHTDSLSEPAKLHIDKLNTTSQGYETDYESEFDFVQAQDERDQFTTKLLQGGLQELIRNNEDVKYSIPVSGSAVKTIAIDQPQRLKGRALFSTVAFKDGSGAIASANTAEVNWPAYTFVTEDALPLNADNDRPVSYFAPLHSITTGVRPAQGQFLWSNSFNDARNYLLYAETNLYNVRVQGRIQYSFVNNEASDITMRYELWEVTYNKGAGNSGSSPTAIAGTGQNVVVGAGLTVNNHVDFDFTFNLSQGKVLQLVVLKLASPALDVDFAYEDAYSLNITYEYFPAAYTVKGINLYDIGTQLINKVTGGLGTFQSNLLSYPITYKEGIDCRPESVLLMSGRSLRGKSDAEIKISLKEYLKICDVLFCSGMGIEGSKVLLEKKSYFFQRTKANGNTNLIAHLDKLQNWIIEDAVDIRFNELHIGYRDDIDEAGGLNGNEEFNTTLKFTSSLTKNKNIYELICPADASGYKIFKAHVQNINSPDNDNKNDNSLFLLQYKYNPATPSVGTALYPSDISASYQVSGVTDTNRVLNIGLSPKRCLIRHLYWLLSHFYNSHANTDDYLLKYQTTDRNPNLQARLSTNLSIAEASDVYLDQEATNYGQSRLFYPIYVKPETVSPDNYKQRWADNRYGVFTTDIEGVTVEGYPLTVKERNRVPKVHEAKLLLTANNNLTDLIM